jgi:hypothetical protein
MPKPGDVSIFRVVPAVISVLDYNKGFGHTDLVQCRQAGERLEARTGIEPVYAALQAAASPLCHLAG